MGNEQPRPKMNIDEYIKTAPSDSKDVPNFHFTKKFKNPYVEVGDYTYGVPNLHYTSPQNRLKIGKFCSIGGGVHFYLGGNHSTDSVSTYPFYCLLSDFPKVRDVPVKFSKGSITVGNDVWFGNGCTILSGVTIGDGAVIGLGSVVTKDVPPYAIVAGNPAQVKRFRFDDDIIASLLRIRWWDWPIERIKQHANLIAGNDPRKLIAVAEK